MENDGNIEKEAIEELGAQAGNISQAKHIS